MWPLILLGLFLLYEKSKGDSVSNIITTGAAKGEQWVKNRYGEPIHIANDAVMAQVDPFNSAIRYMDFTPYTLYFKQGVDENDMAKVVNQRTPPLPMGNWLTFPASNQALFEVQTEADWQIPAIETYLRNSPYLDHFAKGTGIKKTYKLINNNWVLQG